MSQPELQRVAAPEQPPVHTQKLILGKPKKYWTDTVAAYMYLLPSLIILGTFVFYPVIRALFLSFYSWDMLSTPEWVGLGNFVDLVQDDLFWKALGNTFYYVIGTVPTTLVLALGIALLLNSKINFRALFRTAYFVPYVTSAVAITMVWRWIYNDRFGLLNYILGLVHIDPIKWLTSPEWAMPAVIILAIWKMLGYQVVLFLAGLQNIDKEMYEAAKVDGAEGWQLFRNITWPLLSPMTFFILIISVIGAFKVFTEIYVLLGPSAGPLDSGLTVVFYIYDKAFGEWHMGFAAAASYVLFFIIFIFTLIQFRLSRNMVHYT